MLGDEAYAGSESFQRLSQAVQDVLGFEHFIPVYQGRGAEQLLIPALLAQRPSAAPIFISNYHWRC